MAFPSGWGRKVKITIPDAKISGANTDFPILITKDNLPVEMVDAGANAALNGGGDVRFSEDAAGTIQLDLDVVTFVTNASEPSREVELWVKVPTLNTGAAKDIYAWYKKAGEVQPAATAPFGRNATWTLAEMAVLMEDATPVDHTGNHTLSVVGIITSIAGPFGNALDFEGDERLSNSDASLRDIFITHDTTVSVISRRATYIADRGVLSWEGADDLIIYPMDNVFGTTLRVFWRDLGANLFSPAIESLANTWVHNSLTSRASNDHEVYTNGASVATASTTGTAGPFTTFYIGGFGATSQDWNADIAQVIVWKTARTSAWITTEFNNQNDPATFATAGTPEAVDGVGINISIVANYYRQLRNG